MHELSIAMSLVEMATERAAEANARVVAVHIRVGAMAGVVRDALLFSYDVVCRDTPLEGSRLVVEDVPVVVFCPACGEERRAEPDLWLRCAVCGTATPDVRQGRELELYALELES